MFCYWVQSRYCFAFLLRKFEPVFTFLGKKDFACNSSFDIYEDFFIEFDCVESDTSSDLLVTDPFFFYCNTKGMVLLDNGWLQYNSVCSQKYILHCFGSPSSVLERLQCSLQYGVLTVHSARAWSFTEI